jgi:hypothetical protein
MRDVQGKRLQATAERTEIRHVPVETDQVKKAFNEVRRLPQGQAEQNLHRQAGLDGHIAADSGAKKTAQLWNCRLQSVKANVQ